jgi:hypothetical protein
VLSCLTRTSALKERNILWILGIEPEVEGTKPFFDCNAGGCGIIPVNILKVSSQEMLNTNPNFISW